MSQETEPEVLSPDPVSEPEESAPPAPSRGRLTLKRGGELSEVVFEFGYPAVVGRFDPSIGPIDVDLGTIPEGAYVSRRHAKLTLEDGQASVTDMGSSNGTYVVGESGEFERVEFAAVNDGQEVAFGNARFIFHLIGG